MIKLVLIYVEGPNDGGVLKYVERMAEGLGLKLLPHIYLTWRSERDVERILYNVKEEVVRRLERGEGRAAIETAVIDLSSEQYNKLRPLVVRRVEELANRLAEEAAKLLNKVRSNMGRKAQIPRGLVDEYRRINRELDKLLRIRSILDVYPTALEKLIEVVKTLRTEMQF